MLGQAWSVRHLLPTDRPDWSNETGKEAMPRDAQRLPSDAWVWDGDWRVDLALLRRATTGSGGSGGVDEEGWEYAIDFPREYTPHRMWYHSVRRRRWIRVRRLREAVEAEDVARNLREAEQSKRGGGANMQPDDRSAVAAASLIGDPVFSMAGFAFEQSRAITAEKIAEFELPACRCVACVCSGSPSRAVGLFPVRALSDWAHALRTVQSKMPRMDFVGSVSIPVAAAVVTEATSHAEAMLSFPTAAEAASTSTSVVALTRQPSDRMSPDKRVASRRKSLLDHFDIISEQEIAVVDSRAQYAADDGDNDDSQYLLPSLSALRSMELPSLSAPTLSFSSSSDLFRPVSRADSTPTMASTAGTDFAGADDTGTASDFRAHSPLFSGGPNTASLHRVALHDIKFALTLRNRDSLLNLAMAYVAVATEVFEAKLEPVIAMTSPLALPVPAPVPLCSEIPPWLLWTQADFVQPLLGVDLTFAQCSIHSPHAGGSIVLGVARVGLEARAHWRHRRVEQVENSTGIGSSSGSRASGGVRVFRDGADHLFEVNARVASVEVCLAPADVEVDAKMAWLDIDRGGAQLAWSKGVLKSIVDGFSMEGTVCLHPASLSAPPLPPPPPQQLPLPDGAVADSGVSLSPTPSPTRSTSFMSRKFQGGGSVFGASATGAVGICHYAPSPMSSPMSSPMGGRGRSASGFNFGVVGNRGGGTVSGGSGDDAENASSGGRSKNAPPPSPALPPSTATSTSTAASRASFGTLRMPRRFRSNIQVKAGHQDESMPINAFQFYLGPLHVGLDGDQLYLMLNILKDVFTSAFPPSLRALAELTPLLGVNLADLFVDTNNSKSGESTSSSPKSDLVLSAAERESPSKYLARARRVRAERRWGIFRLMRALHGLSLSSSSVSTAGGSATTSVANHTDQLDAISASILDSVAFSHWLAAAPLSAPSASNASAASRFPVADGGDRERKYLRTRLTQLWVQYAEAAMHCDALASAHYEAEAAARALQHASSVTAAPLRNVQVLRWLSKSINSTNQLSSVAFIIQLSLQQKIVSSIVVMFVSVTNNVETSLLNHR